ncbi:hypothetical protein Tco_0556629 [Tanacetum coccineum]
MTARRPTATRDKNTDESWEIIENLALYDHESWNDTKEFVKPIKAISIPQSTSKIPDPRLLELQDQINFLLKGLRPTPRPSSTHISQAYAKAVYLNTRPRNQNYPPNRAPKKVLIKEDVNSRVTKNVNSTSLTRGEEEREYDNDIVTGDDIKKATETETEVAVKEAKTKTKNKSIKKAEKEEAVEAPRS